MATYSFKEIVELAKTEENKPLRLHWEGEESEAKKVTPWRILDDVADGDYTPAQFDEIGYCVSEEDYQEESEAQAKTLEDSGCAGCRGWWSSSYCKYCKAAQEETNGKAK